MGGLRLGLSLLGLALFAACILALLLAFVARAFAIEPLAWVEPAFAGWLSGALLVVLVLRYLVIRVQRSGMQQE